MYAAEGVGRGGVRAGSAKEGKRESGRARCSRWEARGTRESIECRLFRQLPGGQDASFPRRSELYLYLSACPWPQRFLVTRLHRHRAAAAHLPPRLFCLESSVMFASAPAGVVWKRPGSASSGQMHQCMHCSRRRPAPRAFLNLITGEPPFEAARGPSGTTCQI